MRLPRAERVHEKRILLSTVPGPRELVDGIELCDIMAARLARGQGVFTPTGHAHCWALYPIAGNLRAEGTVLENPSFSDRIVRRSEVGR